MKSLFYYFIILYVTTSIAFAQHLNEYGLRIVNSKAEYLTSVKERSDNQLVELRKLIPNIKLDIRYATENNFTNKVVYRQARAFLRKPAAHALKNVQEELKKYGLGLKIFDGYRPYSATLKFWELVKDSTFVASPRHGSKHNRGCAVDLTLINLKSKRELEMPTGFDNFSDTAGAFFSPVSVNAERNRKLLQDVMTKNGFVIYSGEWWHFDFKDWKIFDIMDIEFSQL